MNKNYTSKQIEKYKRQKYISTLNKCTKNLYKLFKDEQSSYNTYKKRFILLKQELDKLENIRLDTEYLKKTKEYIDNLFISTIKNKITNENDFQSIKNSQLTSLNRLQKMKNKTKYNKMKHKDNFF